MSLLRKCVLLVSFMLHSTWSWAASVLPMNLTLLTETSDTIAVVETLESVARWNGNKIYTDHTVRVIDSIKGDQSFEYVVRVIGGAAEHPRLKTIVNMSVPGSPEFIIGDKMVLFTKKSASGVNQLVGLSQGKFLISNDPETGVETVAVGQKKFTRKSESSVDELLFFSLDAAIQDNATNLIIQNLSVNEFLTLIRSSMAEGSHGE